MCTLVYRSVMLVYRNVLHKHFRSNKNEQGDMSLICTKILWILKCSFYDDVSDGFRWVHLEHQHETTCSLSEYGCYVQLDPPHQPMRNMYLQQRRVAVFLFHQPMFCGQVNSPIVPWIVTQKVSCMPLPCNDSGPRASLELLSLGQSSYWNKT